MEQIAVFLEGLGYTVEEHGGIQRYLIVCRDNKPLGFILSDLTVSMAGSLEGQEQLEEIVSFVKDNHDLQAVSEGGYILATYQRHQLIVSYDLHLRSVRYMAVIVDKNGEARCSSYDDRDNAVKNFVFSSGMADKNAFFKKEKLSERLRWRLIRWLQG